MNIPIYVKKHGLNRDPIVHPWSDWDPYDLIEEPDYESIQAFNSISLYGLLSFVIGCIEWVTVRCSHDEDYRLPYEYIEAFWVYLAGIEEALPEETNQDDRWQGALDGPINLVIGKFYTTLHTSDLGGSNREAAFAAQVAIHVLSNNPTPFIEWQTYVLDRLNKYYPYKKKDDIREVVPQEILDCDTEFNPEKTKALIKYKLNDLNFEKNRFLLPIKDKIIVYTRGI